jgi:phospholipase/carboxylesterase
MSTRFPSHLTSLGHIEDPNVPVVILFHGFGADMHDLASLRELLTPPESRLNWIFPNGPFSVPIGPGWTGSAWWPLQMSSLPNDWSDITPDDLPRVKELVYSLISSLKMPWNRIILGGFSQGAMLATEIYLTAPETPLGLLSLSGSLIRRSIWKELLPQRIGEKVFLSHGEQDSSLPSRGTHKLLELFKGADMGVDFVSFRGGHEIPAAVCQRAQNYIKERLRS